MRLACLSTVVLVSVLALAAGAHAQQTEQERTALARSLFEEGVALGQQGHWDRAVDRYRRVLVLRATPQVRYNLAHALSQLGEVVEPVELCRQILRDAAAPAAARADAQRLLDELEPRVARLTIRLTGEPAGAEVTMDGHPVESVSVGVAMPVDPGEHTVAAVRANETVASETVSIAAGASQEVTLVVPPAPVEAAAASPPDREVVAAASVDASLVADEDEGGGAWWPWALLGVAVAAGAVVAVLLLTRDEPESIDGNLVPGRIVFE